MVMSHIAVLEMEGGTTGCGCWVGMVKVTTLSTLVQSLPGFSFEARGQAEMKIWCIKGMYMLKVVSSEKNQVLKSE